MKRSSTLALAVALCGVALASTASADWPMARHDAQRTGAASGTSNITSPVPYWRAYLGGTVGDRSAMPVDVDGDGKAEVVFVGGGRLFARKADDTEIWKTPLINIATLDAAVDVDGDGTLDIIGHSTNQVLIVNSSTGSLEWSEPLGEMGTIGGVRVADFNRDGLPDVYVQECGSCAVVSGNTGFAYSFASGFGTAKQLWVAPFVAGGGQRALTVADVDGDSHPELMVGSNTALSVLDGATGATLATTPSLGTFMQWSACLPVDVDGAPGEELACILSVRFVQDDSGHRIFLVHYAATNPPSLSLVWQQSVGDANGGVSWAPGTVADLDGDGSLEMTVSGTTASGGINTYVYDAASGTLLATLPGQKFVGAAKLASPTKSVVLTASGTTTSAWSFSRSASQPFSLLWSLPEHEVLTNPDWDLVKRSWIADAVVATDLSGDGLDDLITRTLGPGQSELGAYSAAGGSVAPLGALAFPSGVEPLEAWAAPPINRTYPQIMVAGSDGFLRVLDKQLAETASPGIRLGGFYADGRWGHLDSEPVVANLGGTDGEAILATDSSGALVRIDGSNGSFAAPPPTIWRNGRTTGPIALQGLDGSNPGIACWKVQQPVTNPPHYQLAALRADGSPIWLVPIEEQPLRGLVPGKLDSDGVPDLFVQWGRQTDTVLHLRGISGASGATLWNQAVTAGANRAPAGAAAIDWNGDGHDDLVFQFYGTRIASGVDGSEIAVHSDAVAYAMPTLYDVDGDGKPEVTLSGTSDVARTLDDDLATTLWQGPKNRPFPYGALAACPGSPPRLVEGSYLDPAQLDITETAGAAAGTATHVVLAGGKKYASESAAVAAGATIGQLTSVSVHDDLSGTGRPSALVGSSDGWLYSVDPCNGSLDFAVDFGAPVGAIVFGDTNNDGLDEVLVSVADGYLYDLRQPPLPAPSWVLDTDPAHGITDTDVDDVTTADTLSGKWSAVAGATSYRVAVARADGSGYVTSPAWQDVGNITATSLHGLPLTDGGRYVFAVKALTGGGASPDAVSDGVTVHFASDGGVDSGAEAGEDGGGDAVAPQDAGAEASDAAPDAAPAPGTIQGGGCACRLSGTSDAPPLAPVLLITAALGGLLVSRRRSGRTKNNSRA